MSVCFLRVCVYLPVRFDEACTFVQIKEKQTNIIKKKKKRNQVYVLKREYLQLSTDANNQRLEFFFLWTGTMYSTSST